MNRLIPENDLYMMLNRGFSQSHIAREYHVSRQAVSARIKYRENSRYPYTELRRFTVVFLRRLGFLVNEITELTKYGGAQTRQILKENGMFMVKDDNNRFTNRTNDARLSSFKMLFLYRLGFTIPEIAKMIDYSFYTVRTYLLQMGYTLKGRYK